MTERVVLAYSGGLDTSVAIPGRAKFAGAASLFLWFVIIFLGRWTAYA